MVCVNQWTPDTIYFILFYFNIVYIVVVSFSVLMFRPAQVAQIAIAIAIQFTFGLQYFVPMDILWRKFSPKISKEKHNIAQIALRAVCVLIMGTVGVLVPKLDPFISLVGAVFFSFLGKMHTTI